MRARRVLPLCLVVLAVGASGAAGGTSSAPRSASASIPSRPEAGPTTSLPRATAASGTRRRDRASSAGSTRRPARRGTSPSESGSAPHGVIVGPDGAPWITDGGLNAIVRVDPKTRRVRRFPLPASSGYANLNTAAFDRRGVLWFTGQSGIYGRLDPSVGKVRVFRAPRGAGPYGITATPSGAVYYASLAGSYLGRVDVARSTVRVLQPPTRDQGARRAWSDSKGRIWVSEWNAGKVAMYAPATGRWREWRLPGASPMPYAVYVDETDIVWLSDFGANALVRFDPRTREVHARPAAELARERQADPRPPRRGVGRGVGRRQARRRPHALAPERLDEVVLERRRDVVDHVRGRKRRQRLHLHYVTRERQPHDL